MKHSLSRTKAFSFMLSGHGGVKYCVQADPVGGVRVSMERWRSVGEQVIRKCWVKIGLIYAIINTKFQSNTHYRSSSFPYERESAHRDEVMGALGIRAFKDDYILREDVELINDTASRRS
uniref:AlNc14C62G4497 protein n=1 Tax=Albugo laibachii Nc14 TaxID=890382 RepID=F0WCX2_9STRA|nr:AlNc14C62G4497 [Albugo laibachii Nc14]|eukprot:CCA19043.1 AlNc14C62G4497 [Albugo laibachii Nc14]